MKKAHWIVVAGIVASSAWMTMLFAEDGADRKGIAIERLRRQAHELRYEADKHNKAGREGSAKELAAKARKLEAEANRLAGFGEKDALRREGDRREGEGRRERDGDREHPEKVRRDGDERREQKGDRERDRDREHKEREGDRDGHHPERDAKKRDGDREQDGKSAEDYKRHLNQLAEKIEYLYKTGHKEEGAALKKKYAEIERQMRAKMGRGDKHHHAESHGEGDRDRKYHELANHVRELTQEAQQLKKAGKHEEAAKVMRHMQEVREHHARRAREEHGDREHAARREGAENVERRIRHIQEAAENLSAAGLHDQARALHRQAEEMAKHMRVQHERGDRDQPERRGEPDRRPEFHRGGDHPDVSRAVQSLRQEVEALKQALREMRAHAERSNRPDRDRD